MSLSLGAAAINTQGFTSTNNNATYAGLTAGRGLIALVLFQDSTTTLNSITVSGESNMTINGSKTNNATLGWSAQTAYLGALSAGGSKSLQATFSNAINSHIFWAEVYDTVAGGIAIDGSAAGASGSTANPSTTITTGSNNSAIFGAISSSSAAPGRGAGYTLLIESDFFNFEQSEYDLDVGAAGGISLAWTGSVGNWVLAGLAVKAAGGGGGFTAKFRKTLSGLGTGVGKRQVHRSH